MSDKPLVNAPNDPLPTRVREDEPHTDPGGKTGYEVTPAAEPLPDTTKQNYTVEAE